jgi:hypothetical protein
MSRWHRGLLGLVLAALLAVTAGCGGSGRSNKPPDTRSAAQYFQEQQAHTVTPNGRIRTDTVQERDGKIEYQTEDGRRWQVGYSRRADATYEYGTPEELK